ncbi:f-box only protein 21 [Caerostris darwini]|uniref:F-box only protein 21 n=1 Tax=Caerostris darwini TaxID=1538125 RepID=A0AAV4UP74_9ARAC|nr:f-box only protein 21 [Caerostris darwini]
MTLTLPDVLIAITLIACVPLQIVLVQHYGSTESNRLYALHKFLNGLTKFQDDYLSLNFLKKLAGYLFLIKSTEPDPDEGESPALEVMHYKHKHGHFSFSSDPRHTRPPHLIFRIGQVVVHKQSKYRGVIIGWDEIAKAPPEWLDQMHGSYNKEWRNMPNYSILVDTRDRLTPQLTYVPQVNIELINSEIIHPLIDGHFEGFDGAQYIPRPWLRTLYPQD